MKDGALPKLNLPVKSVPQKKLLERSTLAIRKREESFSPPPDRFCYKDFKDFVRRTNQIRFKDGWSVHENSDYIEVRLVQNDFIVPKFQLFTDVSLNFSIRVFGWMLPKGHSIYTKYQQSNFNVSVSNLIAEIETYVICDGIDASAVSNSLNIVRHTVPQLFNFKNYQEMNLPRVHQKEYLRAEYCDLLLPSEKVCQSCNKLRIRTSVELKRKSSALLVPAKTKAPVSLTSPERLKLTLGMNRLRCKELEKRIETMRQELEKSSVEIHKPLERLD